MRWGWDGASLGFASGYSVDPIVYRGKDLDLYRYVFDDPSTHTDPSGQFVWWLVQHFTAITEWRITWRDRARNVHNSSGQWTPAWGGQDIGLDLKAIMVQGGTIMTMTIKGHGYEAEYTRASRVPWLSTRERWASHPTAALTMSLAA